MQGGRKLAWICVVAGVTQAAVWAQSLGDVARANRKNKTSAAKVITNDDLEASRAVAQGGPGQGSLQAELEEMRRALREVCEDPATQRGRKLSEREKELLERAAKPLRARRDEYMRLRREAWQELAALEIEFEQELKKAFPDKRPFTQVDMERARSISEEFERRRSGLARRGEGNESGFLEFGRQLEEVGKTCPEAARQVPD